MNPLVPLFMLLAASAVNAIEPVAPQPLRGGAVPIAANDAAAQPRGVQGDELLVFDSYTGSNEYWSVLASPRTFMGMAFDLETDLSADPLISRMVVYMAHNGTTAQTYQRMRARVQLWDVWSGNDQPVFSAPTTLVERSWANFTVAQDTHYSVTLTPDPPIRLSGLTSHGIAINFQGDTGAGFQNIDTLTSLISAGLEPLAVGTNPLIGNVGYMNTDGRTDFNFRPADGFTLAYPTQALALKLYALDTLIQQDIIDFAADPSSPLITDDSFTVSATGGASGNPVTFSVDASSMAACTAGGTHGATITILDQGSCLVHADQAGNATYWAAARQSLAVHIGLGELVLDGGFEAGAETPWVQGSTNFGTPLCSTDCGGANWAVPHGGRFWIWFGGAGNAFEAGFVQQSGVIAAESKWLDFQLRWASSVVAPPDPNAVFSVQIDGTTIFSLTPAEAAMYADGYRQVSLDISAYADGNTHSLRFAGSFAAAKGGSTNVFVDDVGIRAMSDGLFLDGFEAQ